jgi:SAM-dependent methyltransferase
VLTSLQVALLRRRYPAGGSNMDGSAYFGKSKLAVLMGPDFFDRIAGKVVIDFGCGTGRDAVEMATRGATQVIGVDLRESELAKARELAIEHGVADKCLFVTKTGALADVLVSLDAFEHFSDPPLILRLMAGLIKPAGECLVSFGPTWYHPLGGHLFSPFPWAHLLFSERALIEWRSDFRSDGATRFAEVEGGLNQITIAQFERYVAESPLRFDSMTAVPIRPLRRMHTRLTREFTTSIVQCRLRKR